MDQLVGLGVALMGLLGLGIALAIFRQLGAGLVSAAEPKSLVLRTRTRLLEHTELEPAKGGTEGQMQRGVHALRFVVDRRARTLVQIDVAAKGAKDFSKLALELCVPVCESGYVVMWVDAEQPFESLGWPVDLADACRSAGLWGRLAEQHALRLLWAEDYPRLKGMLLGRSLELTQTSAGVLLSVQVNPELFAERGRGDCGDPVLDLLIDSRRVPLAAREAVLALVHGKGAEIGGGRLTLLYPGSLQDVWPELLTLLAIEGV